MCPAALQRVSECLVSECDTLGSPQCNPVFLYCPKGSSTQFVSGKPPVPLNSTFWASSVPASLCLSSTNAPIDYGIFQSGIQLTLLTSFFQKYFSSLYWGFQVGLVAVMAVADLPLCASAAPLCLRPSISALRIPCIPMPSLPMLGLAGMASGALNPVLLFSAPVAARLRATQ